MQAFKNVSITKRQLLSELKRHQKADNFLKGAYKEGEKGCAVGCSLMSLTSKTGIYVTPSAHIKYEEHFGIPEWLARLEDTIFEGVSLRRSKTWPVEFIEAINTGANLDKIKGPFLIFVLKDVLKTFDHDAFPEVKKCIVDVINLYKSGETDSSKFESAANAAAYSAYSAYSAAAHAAAHAAARAAANAAYSAYSAAAHAAANAAAHAAARAAANAAQEKTYAKYANKLIKLLKECK